MIFYFTGTGNSLAAAKRMLAEGERLINMTDCVQKGRCAFTVCPDERVGLVFPVYFGGLPTVVQSFLNHLEIEGNPDYIYAVLTCGGTPCNAGPMLQRRLAEHGFILDAVFPLVMPDNYVVLYPISTEEEQQEILKKADQEMMDIRKAVDAREAREIAESRSGRLMTRFSYPVYVHGRKTKKFYTIDTCVGCGVCATRCPYRAIVMEDGRPKWVKERCALCMACMRCGAIQYGKQTEGRERYTHPDLRKKS